jgi:hypothetical protein
MLVNQPVFFFLFFKNMIFGYCFSPCGVKVATSWNGSESSRLKGFFQIIFLAKNEGEMEFNQAIVFFSMVVVSGCRGQIFVGLLALANSQEEKPRQVGTWQASRIC